MHQPITTISTVQKVTFQYRLLKYCFLILLLVIQNAFAQSTKMDSLELQFTAAENDERKLELLAEMVTAGWEASFDKAMVYANRGLALATLIGDKDSQAQFYELKGRVHANMLRLDSASAYFDKALANYKSTNNKKGQASTLFRIAWVYKRKQQLPQAMDADMTALKLMEAEKDPAGIADAMVRLSDDLSRQGRMKEALDYSKKAIAICQGQQLKAELMSAYFNAANISIAMDDAAQSLAYYDSAIHLNKVNDLGKLSLCDFYNGRGNALKRMHHYPEALSQYKEAQALAMLLNYNNALSTLTANLGEINLLMGNYAEALPFQLKTIETMEASSDFANLVENYTHVSTIYEKLNDFPAALKYLKKARQLRDSTATVASDKAMSEMLTKYESKKKEETIATQQLQLGQQRREQWLSVGVAGLLAILLLVSFRSYRARTKANKLLAAKNAENELLLKEIHHRVKNNLEVVGSLLALQSAQIDDQGTKDAMQESQNRVQSIGIVHQKLYQGTNLGAIEMKDYFINLGEGILDSFGAEKKVQISCVMEELNIDIDTAVPLGLIVNELLTNTIKYAFPDGRAGKVEIKLTKPSGNVLQLRVSDNGVGKSGIVQGTGFGSQLVALLTRQLGGVMREEIHDGTHVYFEFRLGKAA